MVQTCLVAAALHFGAAPACAQWPQAPPATEGAQSNSPQTFFSHPDDSWYWVSGQANSILQLHGRFHSPYEGTNSFKSDFEYKASVVDTLYLGAVLDPHATRYITEAMFDVEETGGRGLSQALGLAGFTNLDVVRNPTLGIAPYISRVELHQIIGFTDETVDNPQGRTWNSLSAKVPARRLELRAGKVSTVDFFDINQEASDSHLQFTNWTIDNTGAYDYAADTRGYTYGLLADYEARTWGIRYGLMLMPAVANGLDLEWDLRKARGEQVEVEHRRKFGKRLGTARALAYWNHANMGVYRDAVNNYLDGVTPTPEITAHPFRTTLKYGFATNTDYELSENVTAFARFGWNEGQHEDYAYTEDDETFVFGVEYDPQNLGRKYDKSGIAVVTNAIKRDHQKYLALGGLGFILGDGPHCPGTCLNYAREDIVEAYYTAHFWRGLYGAVQASYITHPGYNQDRGPIFIPGARVHVEF